MPDDRSIIALDLDNFYVGVERLLDPKLVGRPVGIRQKGILATCSYEARARGVGKLMGIREAKEKCPEMVIVDGSDLTNYRAYSGRVFRLARAVLGPATAVEKLGMDELFLDVSALVRTHVASSRSEDLVRSDDGDGRRWMALQGDEGFWYEPGKYAGHLMPEAPPSPSSSSLPSSSSPSAAEQESQVASHLAAHLRALILDRIGLTSSAGVSSTKLLSKLLASVHKPADQTTLRATATAADVRAFLDPLDLRKLPGFGSSIVGTLLPRLPPELDGSAPTRPTVAAIRSSLALSDFQALYMPRLAPILHGLLSGSDDSPVVPSPQYPAQISTEDSFAVTVNQHGGMRWHELVGHLRRLLEALLLRLEAELALPPLDEDRPPALDKGKARERLAQAGASASAGRKPPAWARYPQTLRLSLRRSWDAPASARSSKSTPFPPSTLSTARPVPERVTELFGGPGAKDGVGGVVGGLLRGLLGKEWGKDGLHVYVINWAATSLSTSPPAAADQTLSAFLAPAASSTSAPRPSIKRKIPPDLDVEMLRSLPTDLRAEVLHEYGLREADLAGAEPAASMPGSKRAKKDAEVEIIDLTSDVEEDALGEVWEEWPDEEFADVATAVVGHGEATAAGEEEGSKVRCPEPGCDALVFPFALPAHQAFHSA